jgi:hypothetical protein
MLISPAAIMLIRTEKFRIRGVHFLFDPHFMEPKHGHEYFLEVSVDAGCPREDVQSVMAHEVLEKWDRQDWNTMGLAQASGELLVERFDEILRGSKIGADLVAVVLRETRKNRFVSQKSRMDFSD